MASPSFDSLPYFDSIRADDTTYTEGVLWLPDYDQIRQRLHFNGEDGDRYLKHGWADRQWVFKGLMSADTLARLQTRLSDLQDAIDNAVYHALQDSFGTVYPAALIHHLHVADIHKADDGYVAQVLVTGVVQGMVHDGDGGE